MSSPLDIADLNHRAQQIFAKVDEAGWEAWTATRRRRGPLHDPDRPQRGRGPGRHHPVVARPRHRQDLDDAEGDGRELPGINAVMSYLVEEMRLD